MVVHEDDRRKLTSLPEAKILEIKEDCVIGKHYHKVKTEYFVLCAGQAKLTTKSVLTGVVEEMAMQLGQLITIHPEVYHEFFITKGSILMGACTHAYNLTDDYHL